MRCVKCTRTIYVTNQLTISYGAYAESTRRRRRRRCRSHIQARIFWKCENNLKFKLESSSRACTKRTREFGGKIIIIFARELMAGARAGVRFVSRAKVTYPAAVWKIPAAGRRTKMYKNNFFLALYRVAECIAIDCSISPRKNYRKLNSLCLLRRVTGNVCSRCN